MIFTHKALGLDSRGRQPRINKERVARATSPFRKGVATDADKCAMGSKPDGRDYRLGSREPGPARDAPP
ncbi:hypothetical protein GCM10011494_34300 [Novosphingobium endophyticum]|uniref:Uncharacterized protein n=1 Tax=Novosphingobium endophyticum TaxID=1955250 RepID=A0A916X613_9SPHN|nr:hypothetical protein GCM10011494_34300 [Novosphingobium endophyticum]